MEALTSGKVVNDSKMKAAGRSPCRLAGWYIHGREQKKNLRLIDGVAADDDRARTDDAAPLFSTIFQDNPFSKFF